MRFALYIDTKFTADGLRVFVKLLSDTPGMSSIFLVRLERRLKGSSGKIPVFLFGKQYFFEGLNRIKYIQDAGTYEVVATPNQAIGLGSQYRSVVSDTLVLLGSNKLDQSYLGASVKFTSIPALWKSIQVPYSYGNAITYDQLFNQETSEIKIVDILSNNTAKLNIDMPFNAADNLMCQIIGNDTITSGCIIQSSYKGTNTVPLPDPYELVLRDSFIELVENEVRALTFVNSIKADVKKYVDQLKLVGNINNVEIVEYVL